MGYLKNELTGFVPVEQATDIIKMVTRGSSVLRMAKVEEMKHEKKKFNVHNRRVYLAEYKRYVELTVVYDTDNHLFIGIMRDITDEEKEREKKESISKQTIETADKVVDKQMRIVQEIASLLGETAAETKIALTKLKESIKDE